MSKTMTAKTAKPPLAQAQRLVKPDFVRRDWCFTMPAGTTREDLLAPGYWRNVSHQLSRGDLIELRDDFLTCYAKLWVVAVDRPTGNIEVRLLDWQDVEPATVRPGLQSGFTPRDCGVHDGWMIIRDSDGEVLKRNIASFNEAMRMIKVEFTAEPAATVR